MNSKLFQACKKNLEINYIVWKLTVRQKNTAKSETKKGRKERRVEGREGGRENL